MVMPSREQPMSLATHPPTGVFDMPPGYAMRSWSGDMTRLTFGIHAGIFPGNVSDEADMKIEDHFKMLAWFHDLLAMPRTSEGRNDA